MQCNEIFPKYFLLKKETANRMDYFNMVLIMVIFFIFMTILGNSDTVQASNVLDSHGGKRWAICIGINNYDDKNLNKLENAAYDAIGLSQMLKENGDFNVFTFTDIEKDGKYRPYKSNFFPHPEQAGGLFGKYFHE